MVGVSCVSTGTAAWSVHECQTYLAVEFIDDWVMDLGASHLLEVLEGT